MAFSSKTSDAASADALTGCLVFGLLLWSSITLFSDGAALWQARRQIQAIGFPTTPGQITHCSLEEHPDAEGNTAYSPKITYKYVLDGKEYKGKRLRFNQGPTNEHEACRIVDAFPVGREIEVHYDPANPAESALNVGLEGSDFYQPMILLPFNLAMVGMWLAIGGRLYRRAFKTPTGGAKVITHGLTTRIRLSRTRPLIVGLSVATVSAFIIVLFGYGSNPPLSAMYVAWIVILGAGLIAYVRSHIKAARAENTLTIDEARQVLILPIGCDRTAALVVPIEKTVGIEVEEIVYEHSKVERSYSYAPTVVFTDTDGARRREKLAEWRSQKDATHLADWLRERLRLTPPKEELDGGPK